MLKQTNEIGRFGKAFIFIYNYLMNDTVNLCKDKHLFISEAIITLKIHDKSHKHSSIFPHTGKSFYQKIENMGHLKSNITM